MVSQPVGPGHLFEVQRALHLRRCHLDVRFLPGLRREAKLDKRFKPHLREKGPLGVKNTFLGKTPKK